MKKMRGIYLIICLIAIIFLVYKEVGYVIEFSKICKINKNRKQEVLQELDKNYQPREEGFYIKKAKK